MSSASEDKNSIRKNLIGQLINEHAFWSYNIRNPYEINDDVLIEKALIHLDIEYIINLCHLFPKKYLMKVWKEKLISNNETYYNLNRFYAFWLFDIKNPDRYLKNQLKQESKLKR